MRRVRSVLAVCATLALAGGGAVAAAAPAQAATFEVTNLADSGAGSLRQAILDANATPGADVVTFASGLTGEIALTSGTITVTDATTLDGPGASQLTVAGDGTGSVFAVTSPAQVVFSGVTITGGGGAGSNSGGVYVNNGGADVTIRDTILTGNTGTYGGGASAYSGLLRIEDTRIFGNTATASGGGVATASSTVLERVEISGNTAPNSGGGIFLNSGTLVIGDSTISGDSAPVGGGIYRFTAGATLTVSGSTIVGNDSTDGTAGGISGPGSSTISGSVISGNANSDIAGSFAVSWSLIGDVPGGVNDLGGNLLDVDPLLGPLADNGGPTWTHLPLASSPVIDAGDPSITSSAAVDQRGEPRVARSTAAGPERIDLGAVEIQAAPAASPEPAPTAPTLAATGVEPLGMLVLAVVVLGSGAVLLRSGRRRHS
ncbi:choice-of-anchor Q domain-containing protein [Protaetiibacter mangrovi]|uniref:Right-handed parallel beta-helix repeat-containing protein n=1 Tax=Protaetiibacter mangrovi TaxID=2970926 RepID=A0ABT1ZIZ5_9MICO|nr:choice-of-anchor Q domain-containing protein [Protaetiibacter mangrovi]MCS0500676.1 hypothetical protein [Protaetiibacter mangrovi]